MKLIRGKQYYDATEAVQFTVDSVARRYEGAMEKAAARHDALQEIVGKLIAAMMENGRLRAEQLEGLFDYDFIVED